jgi:ribosome-binding protein aMBF1 (putative translation factor)
MRSGGFRPAWHRRAERPKPDTVDPESDRAFCPTETKMTHEASQLSAVIGRNIRRSRVVQDITQREMAARLGISQGYISRVERGKKTPSIHKLELISRALNVSLSELTTAT